MANVNVTYDEMQTAGQQLQVGKNDIETRLDQLNRQVIQLIQGGYVTDVSSKQFEASYEDFDKGVRKVVEGLEGMSSYLTSAANAFRQTDQELSRQLHR